MNRKIVFESSAFEDFNTWVKLDKKIHRKIIELIKNIERNPFQGLGKPKAQNMILVATGRGESTANIV